MKFTLFLWGCIIYFVSDEDLEKALLAAARKGDVKILRCLLEDDIWNVLGIVDQAVEEGLTSLFEVKLCFVFVQNFLSPKNEKQIIHCMISVYWTSEGLTDIVVLAIMTIQLNNIAYRYFVTIQSYTNCSLRTTVLFILLLVLEMTNYSRYIICSNVFI